MVADRGVDRCELLQTSHAPEPQHRALPSSEGKMRVLGPIVGPPRDLAIIATAEVLQGSPVGAQLVCDDCLRAPVTTHGFLQEFQCSLTIPALRDVALEDFSLMIDGAPEVMHLAVDLHVHLVEVPLPLAALAHAIDALSADLGCEDRAEAVPPVTHSFMAYLDAALVEEIFDVPQRQWETDVEHHRQADDHGAGLEIAEWGAFGHPENLAARSGRLKPSSFDSTGTLDGLGRVVSPRWCDDRISSDYADTRTLSVNEERPGRAKPT